MSGPGGPVLETHAEPLGDAFDLLAGYGPPMGMLFERRGLGVAGSAGIASGIFRASDPSGLSDVVDVLRDTVRRGRDVPPVAMGWIGFTRRSRRSPHGLVIPRRAVRRDGPGAIWRIDTTDTEGRSGGPCPFDRVVARAPRAPFAQMQLREVPAAGAYEQAVREAVLRIRRGEMRKVVLARTVEVQAERELDPRLLALRLRAVDPGAYTFAVPEDDGILVGASPELLVSRRALEVRSNPLAGSAPRSGDPEEDRANAHALIGSSKEQEEHAIVVDAVEETLRPFCAELTWDREPVLHETPNVWHLSTRFRGVLRDASPPTALDLVAALHPTPAVAGEPREPALDAIGELERFDRGRYAGAVGWVDADGDGEWAIALRCAELRGDRAVLYAGAGIVADSDPARELDETERKFRAFLDSLRWG